MVVLSGRATTEIYTLSLHDALPISICSLKRRFNSAGMPGRHNPNRPCRDRKSTRLNSSHLGISYAGFRLKKKNRHPPRQEPPPRHTPPHKPPPAAALP